MYDNADIINHLSFLCDHADFIRSSFNAFLFLFTNFGIGCDPISLCPLYAQTIRHVYFSYQWVPRVRLCLGLLQIQPFSHATGPISVFGNVTPAVLIRSKWPFNRVSFKQLQISLEAFRKTKWHLYISRAIKGSEVFYKQP